MRRIHFPIGALGLIACLSLATCDRSGSTFFNDLISGTSNNDSVGDVTPDGGGLTTPGPVFPLIDAVRARVRNESSARADVTMRFIRDESVIHLAFVRVLPNTITTVASPETAEVVELSGLDDRGRALTGARFVFGVDFDETSPAEYTVVDDEAVEPAPAEDTDTVADDVVVRPVPEPPVESPSDRPVLPHLTMVEPAHDVSVSLGSTLTTQWVDTDGSLGAVVTMFLQPIAASDARNLVQMGPGVGVALDGINDELEVVIQDLDPGVYRVVGRVELRVGGASLTATAFAPGVVRVVLDPGNAAPALDIRSPETTVELRNGDSLSVAWDDYDPDDNATITFTLVSTGLADAAVESFAIGPPIAENPDGARFDSVTLVVRDVLPGFYDLLGTIDDGELVGTDRVERAVRILPAVDNDPSQLVLIEPSSDVDMEIGRSLLVRWTDSDANDDARISLLLDPDLGNVPLDGDEVLLAASLGENEDGAGDQIRLGIPPEVAVGKYRLVGAITDGLTQTLTRAPGLVRISQASPTPDNGGGPGIIDVIPPPPPPPPPPPWTVTPLGPIGALVVQTGEVVTVIFNSAFDPTRNAGRVYLSNRRYGGGVRLNVEQTELDQGDVHSLLVPIRTETIANDAWPRSFDIEVETVVDGVVQVHVGPRPVWILQEAHVLNAALIGHSCIPSGAAVLGSPEVSVEITWYGGGLLEEELNPLVRFWLTKDGSVPESGADDATHRLIGQAPGSPNLVRTVLFDADPGVLSVNVTGDVESSNPADSLAGAPLEAGEYRIVTVFDAEGINRTVSAPSADSVSVCNPTRSPNTDKLP